MIASSEIKFDETTVTGFSAKDRMPTVNRIEMPLINIGSTIQCRLRKKKNSRVTMQIKTSEPKSAKSDFTKLIISAAIMGMPLI